MIADEDDDPLDAEAPGWLVADKVTVEAVEVEREVTAELEVEVMFPEVDDVDENVVPVENPVVIVLDTELAVVGPEAVLLD